MEQFEVYPEKDGWNWRRRGADGKSKGSGPGYGSRADAIAGAREEGRGDERLQLTRGDGSLVQKVFQRGGPERIVLLRADGSEHGEIDHALRHGGQAQTVSITPAAESTKAVSNGG